MLSRRQCLIAGGVAAAAPTALFGAGPKAADFDSDVIYLSPLKSNGKLSRCRSEVWFASVEGAQYVVTATGAWRARAIRQGLTSARMWVGDVGAWLDSDGAYLDLPTAITRASVVTAADEREAALETMGEKYRMSWLVWGPRFRNGLADGSRVMLKYRIV